MKYLKKRNEFLNNISLPKPSNKNEINLPINEKFDMSGGQGPMGNDINWGDSLVGRLFNSISRKLVIGVNKGRIALINKQIREAFDSLLIESQIQSSDVNRKDVEKIEISYFLEKLTSAVHSGMMVKYIIELTEETIRLVESNDELVDKDELIKQLNEFLEFLNEFDEEDGEDLDEEVTGMSKEELAKGSDIESQGDGWKNDKEALKGMKLILLNLKGIIDNQGSAETTKDSDSELNKMKQPIIQQLNQSKIDIKEIKTNDGVSLQLNGKNLITFLKYDHKPDATIIIHGYNWDGTSLNAISPPSVPPAKDDDKSEPINIGSDDKSEPINIGSKKQNEISTIIKSLLNYIKPKDTDKDTNKDVGVGSGNDKKIEATKPDTIINKGENKSRIKVDGKEIEVDTNESFIFEKSKLSEEETDSNQALNKLKNQINILTGTTKGTKIAITSDFLKNLLSTYDNPPTIASGVNQGFTDEKIQKKNSEILKNLFNDIKTQYEKMDDLDELYEGINESFEILSDVTKRQTIAITIAKFAKRSMQFVGENLYGTIGELGKYLKLFNDEFNKLLNTDLKVEESSVSESNLYNMINNRKRVSSYSQFMMINESATQKIITYYDTNVKYNKWKIENKQIITQIDEQIKNAEIKEIPIDPIIEIVKLINRAYKIHTPGAIPSGRTDGKVTNRTFREYDNMAKNDSGTAERPGSGPYRNKNLFNQFESVILDITGEKKYKKLFSENVTITEGSSINVTITDDKEQKKIGNGKILLKFMTAILDGNSLYTEGAQQKFFAEYFGFTIAGKDLGEVGKSIEGPGKSKTGDDDTGAKNKEKALFSNSSQSITEKDKGKVYILKNERDNTKRYMVVLGEYKNDLYFKSSADPKFIQDYLENYDINGIDKFTREKNTSLNVSFLCKTSQKEIVSKVKIEPLDLEEFNKTNKLDWSKEIPYFDFDKKQVLVKEDDQNVAIKVEDPSSGTKDEKFSILKNKF